jgi:hypothetical protein
MWTLLLDPATQGVALVGVLCALGFVAFDLVAEVRAPNASDRSRRRSERRAPAAEARAPRAAVGPMMETWTDAAGETRGVIRRGPCAHRRLEDLSQNDCQAQAAYARAHDPGSAATMEAYIRRRFASPPPRRREESAMTRARALQELGLGADAKAADIHAAYLREIKRHHPDHGGDHAKAARINAANDFLTG